MPSYVAATVPMQAGSRLVQHLVRWGSLGFVAAFTAADARRYERGTRVVLRTGRGVEVGEVLAPLEATTAGNGETSAPLAGTLLRGMTDQDHLLELRLRKNRHEAYDACRARLQTLGIDAALVDVEQLFDGRSLVFYFLGEQPPQLVDVTEQLAEAYDAKAQITAFAETLVAGCGPDCGTEAASGQGCSSCATGCAVAAACSTRSHHHA